MISDAKQLKPFVCGCLKYSSLWIGVGASHRVCMGISQMPHCSLLLAPTSLQGSTTVS